MRYVSLVFIVFVMWWSWSVIKSPALLPENTHIGIQEDLRRVITEYITENLAGIKDLRFERFWTQTLKENQIKATFAYSFDDPSTTDAPGARVGVDGYAILNRAKDENSEFDVWNLDELYVLNNRVTFKEGITIRAAEDGSVSAEEGSASSKEGAVSVDGEDNAKNAVSAPVKEDHAEKENQDE